jgi:hypothetical protein
MPDTNAINRFLQAKLRTRKMGCVGAVQAAQWLDAAGLLADRTKGLPLRKLLRADKIQGARQEPPQRYGKWFIYRLS